MTVKPRPIKSKVNLASQICQVISLSNFRLPTVFNGCCSLLQIQIPEVDAMHDGQDLKHPLACNIQQVCVVIASGMC